LAERLKDAAQICDNEKRKLRRIVIHKEGEVWSDTELDTIKDVIGVSEIIGVKKVSIPRMYDTETRKDYMVERGAYVQIDSNAALLATSGLPHPIRGAQRCLTVQAYYPEVSNEMLMRVCKEIFELTLVYGGYSLAVTSKPITTHFANAAVDLASRYRIRDNPKLWRQAWFV
jgi:hypothetical protein